MNTTVTQRICPLCEACCGLDIHVTDGRVTAIRGHEADVFSAGYMCPKGFALKDLQEDPDRLRTPLIKRDGRFEPASWDEAFAEIERRLVPLREQHGAQSVAVAVGNPSSHKMGLMLYYSRLMKALGTRNVFSASTLDQMPKQLSSGWMFGHWLSIAVPDIERTDLLIVLGANPAASNGSLWTVPDFRGKAKALRARGGRLVVIDPRRSETAELADEHLTIRPQGDAFLLLGMAATLFEEGLVRTGRLTEHLAGLDDVRAAVAPFTAERVAERCGIEAAVIRRLARSLAAAPRAVLYGRMGTCVQPFGTLCSWLIDVLNALTGHLDEPGGAMFPLAPAFQANSTGEPGRGRGIVTGRHHSRVSGAPEVFGELPMTCLAEEIEMAGDGQVRALLTVASNPVLSAPNGRRLSAALDSLDFMVSVDIYLNETTRHADVILPGLAPLEDSHYDVAFHQLAFRNVARYSPAVLAAADGRWPEWKILLKLQAIATGRGAQADVEALDTELVAAELARTMGSRSAQVMAAVQGLTGPERLLEISLRTGPYGDGFGTRPDGLTLARLRAAPSGIDLGPLQPRLPDLLRTPSGKVELAPATLIADVARAQADLSTPAPDMVLIGRRQVRSNNSWMHNLPTLAKGSFRCTLLVHPADAERLSLSHGGRARISRGTGAPAIDAEVEVSDEVMRGVVSLPHGWGHVREGTRLSVASERPGVSLNDVLDENLRDPLSGNAVLGGVGVQVTALA
ncbi:MAG: molybdopterin-dependent oxidoreductase [Rhizobacter sp.]